MLSDGWIGIHPWGLAIELREASLWQRITILGIQDVSFKMGFHPNHSYQKYRHSMNYRSSYLE